MGSPSGVSLQRSRYFAEHDTEDTTLRESADRPTPAAISSSHLQLYCSAPCVMEATQLETWGAFRVDRGVV
jgi:hypothetical protein